MTVSALNVALNVRMSKTGDGPRQAERDLRQLRKAAGDLGREAGAAKLNREVAKVGSSAAIADRALRSARRSAADLGAGASGAARLSRELDHVARSAETAHRALNRGGLGRRIINGAGGGHMAEAGGAGVALGFGARALAPLGVGYGAYRAGEAAVSFEKAMAEVKKKVDINNPGDIEYLETRIRKIAIQLGIARSEVAGLVAEAGASGIPYNDLEEYMRLVAKASVGWDVSARETAEKLAGIRAGFGMNMKELAELGDMINGLGDNSAAKERDIVEMLGRTGAAAQAANVPLKTTLAVMTAVRSTGMQEEVVARWFASLASTLRTAPQQPKRVSEGLKMLGLTAKGVAAGMKKDATGTMLELFEKLEKAPDMATAAIKIFGREWWDETARAGKALPEIKRMLAFIKDPKNYAGSRDEFERLLGQDPDRLTDLQRAARFLYLQKLAFGGKVAGRTFGTGIQPARFDINRLAPLLADVHERLSGVWIECLPWEQFLERWDRPETLFFLDPPYHGSEHYYGRGLFERAEFERLAAALKGLRGRFLMTLNDHPEVRRIFSGFRMEAAEVTYTVGSGNTTRAGELIISGPR